MGGIKGSTRALAILGALALLGGCGREGEVTAHATNSTIGATDYTFFIGPTALSAQIGTVPPGGRVTFINLDDSGHQVVSDGPAGKPDCPELEGPPIPPQGSYTFVMADHAETCGFHDVFLPTTSVTAASSNASAPLVQGTIVVGSVKNPPSVVVTPGSSGSDSTNVVAP